jgi:hypothetical protein
MSLFNYYYGFIRVGDGKESWETHAKKIVCHENGTRMTIKTDGRVITEVKVTKGNKILEWEKLGAFYRGYKTIEYENISAPVIWRYHPKSLRSLHGIAERLDQKLFGKKGKCRTRYSRGRMLWQDFRYANHHLAYRLNQSDKEVVIKYYDGKVAGIVRCPEKGFSTRGGEVSRSDTHTCYKGEAYFKVNKREDWEDEKRDFDFSRDGNCQFIFYDRRGNIRTKGEYKNRQRVGEWVVRGKSVYFISGVMVAKKLWDTPPEKLNIKTVLRLKNAQMRAALLARIGAERITKECKYKTIDQTKNGMKLMEFPIKVDDGNGSVKSHMRILMVTCPSTKTKYYLQVPDFVWDGGKKTKLDKCEVARQWTFGVDDPRKKIKFAVET